MAPSSSAPPVNVSKRASASAGLLAITQGDPAGIGGEIIVKAFAEEPALMAGCFVAGDVGHLRRAADVVARWRAGQLGTGSSPESGTESGTDSGGQPEAGALGESGGASGRQSDRLRAPLAIEEIHDPAQALDVGPGAIPVLQLGSPRPLVAFGQVQAAAGRLAADAVTWAARAALQGQIAGLVTAPLHKEALAAAGLEFPGHTELLQAEAASHARCPVAAMPVRMMLASDELRTVLVSIHVSLRQAIEAVTFDNVLQTLRITHEALARVLGRAPRIGVAGLNPHAGEGGLFGREEIEIIAPAIAAARGQGIDAQGPFAPDTVFMRARSTPGSPGQFDVVVAMYHDQGLIPVKYLGLEQGVNVTLGLPLVRTSPDHGTAFDIAGSGRADASSLLAAVRAARRLIS